VRIRSLVVVVDGAGVYACGAGVEPGVDDSGVELWDPTDLSVAGVGNGVDACTDGGLGILM
jgi:hypothetical protein